ncbi:hypothetical protein SELMODRAFT_404340 [Selaginella moellendorffii]|uniref:Uncharacterized protein n=1 Tax=Selaginella moellendorffii TaxID=88036 RepID=D8QV10_SELML|nr:hypothetical protein SELMODRAFT_404340 [Selaginella moellendorffii]
MEGKSFHAISKAAGIICQKESKLFLSLTVILPAAGVQVFLVPAVLSFLGLDPKPLARLINSSGPFISSAVVESFLRWVSDVTAKQAIALLSSLAISAALWTVSTASLVSTAARVHRGEEISRWEALHFRPRVWLALLSVALCSLLIQALEFALSLSYLHDEVNVIFSLMAFAEYLSMVASLAATVAVLDGFAGVRALREAARLLHRNLPMGLALWVMHYFVFDVGALNNLAASTKEWWWIVLWIFTVSAGSLWWSSVHVAFYFSCLPDEEMKQDYTPLA